ncbi:MAG TPA: beta-phosphoglucomutase family hydrolase [Bacteroidales bacterium]|nr:beta-phosphoglucomutase family hydrolase [Bacteroidales bacterium]
MNFDAVIFDLDGVVTKTALVHGAAWKRMFDDFLRMREEKYGEPFREFTHTDDYLLYVDGKPRYKGVASFLDSRGMPLPFGDPSDSPEKQTVCGLGNRKNLLFNEVLAEKGVEVYDSTLNFIHELRNAGIKVGVASSSKNCKPVLEKAGILDLFETCIDGVVSAELELRGKPEPDIFTTACDRLGVKYSRSVVIEDAVSGVQAGRNGNFGLVIGIARENNIPELKVNGGDIVVDDLERISLHVISEWFEKGLNDDNWSLDYHDYNTEKERSRETLLTIGNGYFGTRGAMEESKANDVNYPGTYISGLYNRLVSRVAKRDIENEDLVNITNWLPLKFRIGEGDWFEFKPQPVFKLHYIRRKLDFRTGELTRELEIEDNEGRVTRLISSRFASMNNTHNAAIRYCVEPVNYSADITIRSELSGDHGNAGVERYRQLKQRHLHHISEEIESNCCFLRVKTSHSHITIAMGARHIVDGNEKLDDIIDCSCSRGKACQDFRVAARKGEKLIFEKLMSVYTSQDKGVTIPIDGVKRSLGEMVDYARELEKSAESWSDIWKRIDIKIGGDRITQKLLRLHLYHIIVTTSPHHKNLDAGIPPRGLHGEAYRGHIFWDELYVIPIFNIHFPEVTRSVLMYRYRRLDRARDNARKHGYRGAMFPWQSGSDGREETQIVHLNPLSGEWGEDYSSLQRHVSLAIAFSTWNYYWITCDTKFMADFGAEIFFDICKFWASKCRYDEASGKYHIDKVMGPDEFHEKLPGSNEGGLTDNAYSNIMVCWMFSKALELAGELSDAELICVMRKLDLSKEEMNSWDDIRRKLFININSDGIIEQFDGYFKLKELDWSRFVDKYKDIHRMDRILKAEGESPDDYKISKQADLLMSFYNLGEERVRSILGSMGHTLPDDLLLRNFNYYIERTSHGSTLSRLVHSALAYRHGHTEPGWEMYHEALKSDLVDIQGGTTGEGIHCGVMAGTVYAVLSVFCGLDLSEDHAHLSPILPARWQKVSFNFDFRGANYKTAVYADKIELSIEGDGKEKIKINICGNSYLLAAGERHTINY